MPCRSALDRTCDEMMAAGRRADILRRRLAAAGYRRERSVLLPRLVPAALWNDGMAHPDDPRVTWRLLRHLCRSLRRMKARGVGDPRPLRQAATCELHLLIRQRGVFFRRLDTNGIDGCIKGG